MDGSKSPTRAEAGVVIGGYELVRRIGRGGMAEVWVARKALGKKGTKFVAIKLIADHHVGDERYARMFRSEAELAAVLSHANIVQVFDEGEDQGRSYLIMEWVDGLNLLKLGDMLALLDDEQRRFRVISYIIGQLLHALNYAHSITSHDGSPLGVVHRDVSPQNVLVSNHGEVKLTDFGVAYYNIEESSGIHVKGKVRYMSPEQLSGKTRSPTVDLFAVGALLHELLEGRKFRGEFEDGQDLFTVVLSGKVSPMTRQVPPELDRLRLGLLEPDVNRRIQTAEQAMVLLKRFPGYGDARDELTKLCGSLTGVVRPRVGPGQSSQVAAADGATTRWGGREPLAKPKVNTGPRRTPPKPPARRSSAPPRATGSTTAVKSPSDAVEDVHALITGQTEFVRPQGLPGMGAAPGVSSSAPTTPLRVNKLRVMASEAGAQASSPGVPAQVPQSPSRPLGGAAMEPAKGAPVFVPAQSSSPLGMHAQAPTYVPGQGSHPIQVQAMPQGMPPTERLVSSEGSGVAAHPGGTEVLDASMILEVSSGSGTDQEIYPVVAAVHEGTDTRRDVRGGMPVRTNSVSIVLPRRSAVAVIGVGLMLVAAMSVSVTWFLFTRGRDGAEVATKSLAAEIPGTKTVEPEVEPPQVEPEPEVAPGDGEMRDSDDERATNEELVAPSPIEEGSTPDPTPGGGEAEEVQEVEEPEEPEEPDAPGVVAVPVSGAAPVKSKPLPKAVVKVAGSSGLNAAQVRIGSQTFAVNDTSEHKITAGRKTIKWRSMPSEPWQTAKSWTFKSGKRFMVYVSKKGPQVRPTS